MIRTGLMASMVLAVGLPCAAAAQDELRIEPPSWWQGFEHRRLQLMVTGEGIADATVRVEAPGIAVTETVPGDDDQYLFVYLELSPEAAVGTFNLEFDIDGEVRKQPYRLDARAPDSRGRRGFDASDTIYLVTPDRFANGDSSNDSVAGYADPPDRAEPYGRHGGDLEGIRQQLDYLADLGVTMLWLNPVLENAMDESSYHGYAITDHYRVDPRFGDNEGYRRLAAAADERGIGLIMDMVENHIGANHPWMSALPMRDWINFDGKFRATNHARTTNQGPYASPADARLMADGWFTPSMPDLNQRNPQLAEYLIQNSIWWIEYAGLAGIRQDTWPYPDKAFMAEWARRIIAEYPNFNIVGEEWSLSPAIVAYWQAGNDNHDGYVSHLPSLFDFPLNDALVRALTDPGKDWGSVWTPVYETLAVDFLYEAPNNLVIFPDNHDMSRIATQLGDDDALLRMALVFTATMRGIPQIFYGTEIGMSHPGTDSHGIIRSDFPGGWPGDDKNAFTGAGLSAAETDRQSFVRRLLRWRRDADVIHDGQLMQLNPERYRYAYARYDDDERVLVAFNRGDEPASIELDRFAGLFEGLRTAVDVLTGERVEVDGTVPVPPMSSRILTFENAADE